MTVPVDLPPISRTSQCPPSVQAKAAQKSALKMLSAAKKAERRAKQTAAASGDELISLAKTKPIAFLKKAGITIEQLLESVANDGEAPPAAATTTEAKLAALEATVAKFQADAKAAADKAETERQTAANTAEETRLKTAVVEQVKAAGDKFPHIKRGEAETLVIDTMIAFHAKNGKTCTVEDAAKATEAYLAKLAGTAKPATATAAALAPAREGTATLTNDGARGRTPANGEDPYSMDPDERLAQVTKAGEGLAAQRGN